MNFTNNNCNVISENNNEFLANYRPLSPEDVFDVCFDMEVPHLFRFYSSFAFFLTICSVLTKNLRLNLIKIFLWYFSKFHA